MKSKTLGLLVFAAAFLTGAAALAFDSFMPRFFYNFLFYGLSGTYQVFCEEYGLREMWWSAGLDELVLSPLFYGGMAYFADRYFITRFFQTPIARIMLLLLLFFLLTIPVIQWYPPGSENFI